MSSSRQPTNYPSLPPAPAARLLEDYFSDDELAVELDTTKRTLTRWDNQRIGPPRTYIGRKPYYHRDDVKEWLRQRKRTFEEKPGRSRHQPHR